MALCFFFFTTRESALQKNKTKVGPVSLQVETDSKQSCRAGLKRPAERDHEKIDVQRRTDIS